MFEEKPSEHIRLAEAPMLTVANEGHSLQLAKIIQEARVDTPHSEATTHPASNHAQASEGRPTSYDEDDVGDDQGRHTHADQEGLRLQVHHPPKLAWALAQLRQDRAAAAPGQWP